MQVAERYIFFPAELETLALPLCVRRWRRPIIFASLSWFLLKVQGHLKSLSMLLPLPAASEKQAAVPLDFHEHMISVPLNLEPKGPIFLIMKLIHRIRHPKKISKKK